MEQKQKLRLTLSPQAQRYARSDAPLEARMMAARGALPLPPVELATVLFALLHDPDVEVKTAAQATLEGLPDAVCFTVLSGETHPAVLSHLAHVYRDSEERLVKIALNPGTDDATVAFLAATHHRKVVDIVSNNQERLLRYPGIVDALGANPLTGRAVIERILTFLGVGEAATDKEDDRSPVDIDSVSEEAAEAALRAILGNDLGQFARELVEERDADLSDDPESSTLYSIVQQMSVFQKIKLARLGNKEARSLLVRDRNKIVSMAAVTSPKMTGQEIIGIAQSRNVCDDVLRAISRSREWTRHYPVKLALATNPKCPTGTALQFINYLQEKDLRKIMRSRDVPAAISSHARRNLMKKGKV